MRHHGLATRILDWTETLAVALYFAVHGPNDGAKPCVWLLNPYALNKHEKSVGSRDLVAPQLLKDDNRVVRDYGSFLVGKFPSFGWDHPVALYPLQLSDRLHAQQGYFTIHGENSRPLEQISPGTVRRVDIKGPKLVDEIKQYLSFAGMNTHLLFPDLDGLSRYLHEKYKIFQSTQTSVYGK